MRARRARSWWVLPHADREKPAWLAPCQPAWTLGCRASPAEPKGANIATVRLSRSVKRADRAKPALYGSVALSSCCHRGSRMTSKSNLLFRFSADQGGNIAIWFALALLPLVFSIGVAVDYSRAATLRTKLQRATDATIVAIAPLASQKSKAELLAIAQTYFAAMMGPDLAKMGGSAARIDDIWISNAQTEMKLYTSAAYPPIIMNIGRLSKDPIPISAYTRTVISNDTFEIALVMDNSGSMGAYVGGRTKMAATKDAAKKLVDTMYASPAIAERTKMSVVPFTLSVKVGAQYYNKTNPSASASWLDLGAKSSIHWENIKLDTRSGAWNPATRFALFKELGVDWAGCVETRPGEHGVKDTPVSQSDGNSYFVPQFAPDEPGTKDQTSTIYSGRFTNSYIDDSNSACQPSSPSSEVDAQQRVCKYRIGGNSSKRSNSRGPNASCDARELTRLTGTAQTIRSAIDGMNASGNTNLFEGFMWGWRTISPNTPFADGRAYGTENNRKIIILMTDGDNVWNSASNTLNRSIYSPFGYYTNNRLASGVTTAAKATTVMDGKTLEACSNAKEKGIIVYTVAFSTPDAPISKAGLSLLTSCASVDPTDSSHRLAYIAATPDEIIAVFEEIARNIGALRIAE
ncbi:Tad domain-containing protein [Chelatococcus sp. XZ-Ab1]|uniref:TadE/TadG family type IV pilus assembly protein n=1 Tax=Chelatococcus sp. XZ-Ab1 TaxID=3034027 RepID=UPI0011476C45|nr:Tad domain-containing protein [Chelatococcus sp. XZ-Ab1]